MKKIKTIIGIVSPFWMVKKNKNLFKICNCDTVEIKSIYDLEKCDALVFPSSISSSLFHYIWEDFLQHIFEKNKEENFPIWLMGQSISLFEKELEIEFVNKKYNFEETTVVDFLTLNEFKMIFFNSFIFRQKKSFLSFLFKKDIEFSFDKNWNACVFKKWNIFATTFCPELSEDIRIYEYFINEFIN